MLPLQMLSIEFFASNTVLSDYQKMNNFLPKGHDCKTVGVELPMPNGLRLYASFYRDEKRAEFLERIMVTFIENEFAEDIMMLCHMEGEREILNPKMYASIRCGGCTLEQLRPKNMLFSEPFFPWHGSAAAMCLREDNLKEKDRRILLDKSKAAMDRLFRVSKQHDRQMRVKRNELLEKSKEFLDMLELARIEIKRLILESPDKERLEASSLMKWVQLPLIAHQEDVYIMFAHHMNVGNVLIRRSFIQRKNSNHKKAHLAMVYDCMYDVDLFWGEVEESLPKKYRTGNRVAVYRATDNLNETPTWKEVQSQAWENKCIIQSSGKGFDGILSYEKMKQIFDNRDDILNYIYHVAKSFQ